MSAISYQTDEALPTLVNQESAGDNVWLYPDYAKLDDGEVAIGGFIAGKDVAAISNAKLIFDSVIDDSSDQASNDTVTTQTYGGSSDLWGATINVADVLNPYFGFAIGFAVDSGGGYSDSSYELKLMGYEKILTIDGSEYSIPSDATIVGIEVEAQASTFSGGGGTTGLGLDTASLIIHLTWSPSITVTGRSYGGAVYRPSEEERGEIPKTYTYRVYDKSGAFIGEWEDVSSDPNYKLALNELMSAMEVEFANAEAIGIDSDTHLNYEVEVRAHYGAYIFLTDETGEPIGTDDFEPILIGDGAPEGRAVFKGFLSRHGVVYSDTENNNKATLISHSDELRNILLETEDTIEVSHDVAPTAEYGIGGGGPGDFNELSQTFLIGGTVDISRIVLRAKRWAGSIPTLTALLKTGSTHDSGTLLGTASVLVTEYLDFADVSLTFDEPITLSAGTYNFTLSTDKAKSGGSSIYPVTFQTASGYGDGSLKYSSNGTTFSDLPEDLLFKVYEAGGETEVTFNSADPSAILRSVLDFARSRGARVNYDAFTIEDTGETVSYTFNTNTIAEAIDKILELAPAGWYYYYDPATDLLYFKERSATPDRYVIKGRHVKRLELWRTLERLINEVLVSGGDTGGGENLLVRVLDTTSRSNWRRGLDRISDGRVTVEATATTLGQNKTDRNKDPQYVGLLEYTAPTGEYLEEIRLGLLLGFIGFGDTAQNIDSLQLQMMSLTYAPDFLTFELDTQLPQITRRIEDINRNIGTLQTKDNPSSPA